MVGATASKAYEAACVEVMAIVRGVGTAVGAWLMAFDWPDVPPGPTSFRRTG